MRLAELMRRCETPLPASWRHYAELELAGVAADSRAVKHGYVFVAVPGTQADGRDFIADAVARGAAAVLAQPGTSWPAGVPGRPLLEDAEPRRRLAQFAAAFAGALPRVVAAVTGTNGKTSTVWFLRQVWELGGRKAASLGTLGVHAPGFAQTSGLTTPDPVKLVALLASLAAQSVHHVAMEASSHGLAQFRLDGVPLAAGAFTSFSRDHLDYHPSMAAYRAAKLRLFQELLPEGAVAAAPVSLETEALAALQVVARERRLKLSLVGEGGDLIRLLRATPCPEGQILELEADGVREEMLLPLPGRFQAENALIAVALAWGLGEEKPLRMLPKLAGVPGRLELAARLSNGAAVYVDYAHTPDALERVLAALRPHTQGRLLVVFGAGGDRDPGKRPLMGRAAAQGADCVIVTDDNPRTENPAAIRAQVLSGCPEAREIAGREQAIAAALEMLRPGDVLVVAGKGHEQGQIIGTHIIPFDDRAVVRRLLGLAP